MSGIVSTSSRQTPFVGRTGREESARVTNGVDLCRSPIERTGDLKDGRIKRSVDSGASEADVESIWRRGRNLDGHRKTGLEQRLQRCLDAFGRRLVNASVNGKTGNRLSLVEEGQVAAIGHPCDRVGNDVEELQAAIAEVF